jgi:hypothetical protein
VKVEIMAYFNGIRYHILNGLELVQLVARCNVVSALDDHTGEKTTQGL